MTQPLPSAAYEPASQTNQRASHIDYSGAGEALIIADLLPVTGDRFLVEMDAGDGLPWSLSRGFIEDGWNCLHARSGDLPLSDILSGQNVRADFHLLILNSAETAASLLSSLDPSRHRPRVIVMHDQQSADVRTSTYRTLNRHGYYYAGMAGQYSLWSVSALQVRNHPPAPSTSLPRLPDAPSAMAMMDHVPGALASAGSAHNQTYLLSGWAFVESPRTVPPLVYVEVRNHRTGVTDYFEAHRCRRPDVSLHFGQPELEMSGFRALVTLNDRMAGALSIGVLQLDARHRYPSAAETVVQRPLEEYEQNPRLGLAKKYLRGTGIEIGALQKPLPLPADCKVRYVDRMALTDLLHHYPELLGLPLQAPDIIDNGEQLSTVASGSQDFVVANHFLEHCQNPFQTLSNFLRVLRTGGVLFMAVPDKRFTFDFDRPCTEYETLKQAYLSGSRANRAHLFHEWVRCVERLSNGDADARASDLDRADYSIHYNVWTVDSLLAQLLLARSEFAFSFRLLTVVCSDNEAILLLENTRAGQSEQAPPNGPGPSPIEKTQTSSPPMPQDNLAISRISSSDSAQTNAKYQTWKYVIPLPPDNLMWSVGGATIENFIVVGDAWAQVVSGYTQENTTLLDIGCGCGRTARVLANNRWITKYIGFDVILDNVDWCKRYITPHWHGTAEFHHFDLYSGEYNPKGSLRAQDFRFPCADGAADVVFAASVFTHLLEPDAIHYLHEVGRCLSARGYAVLSIHNNVAPGYRFCGTEARIEMDSDYFRELASAAGLQEVDRVDDLAGQQAFVFKRR